MAAYAGGDIYGPYGEYPGWMLMDPAGGRGPGWPGGPPGGGLPPPPPNPGAFLGGRAIEPMALAAPGFAGAGSPYQRNRLRPFGIGRGSAMTAPVSTTGFEAGVGGKSPWSPAPRPDDPWGIKGRGGQPVPAVPGGFFGGSTWNPAWDIWTILKNAATGGDPNFGGAFGLNPPAAIMSGVRSRAISDAGARERGDRLRIAGRSDVDPSTYGFQTLMSGLQSGSDLSRSLGNADLSLRQGQLDQYWSLLNALLREGSQSDRAKLNPGGGGIDWGGLIQGLGGLAGAIF